MVIKTVYMKRVITFLAVLFTLQSVEAQTPKAVIKSVAAGDLYKSVEKFEKISDKSLEKMPAACSLAEAALLNMSGQAGIDKIRGYEILVNNLDAIRGSEDVAKMFKGLDVTLDDIILHVENGSCNYVISCDDERTYVLYLDLARRGGHPRCGELESCLERRRYRNAIDGRSIDECNYFLSTYPESEYRTDVESHLALLRYEQALASSDEAIMEGFIADYPHYPNVDKVANRLMQHRYDRIFKGDNLADMKWFVAEYPDHKDMESIKQTMADIEFPMLQSTCEALEAFIAYYPYVSQISQAREKLQRAKIIEQGSVADFVAYVRANGYDSFYPEMLRYIYAYTGRYIITPDIADVTLLHFANEDGLTGYMDLEGNVVIEARYGAERAEYGPALYNNFMLSEFTTYRNVAVVKLDGKWGVIDSEGHTVVPHNYQMVTIYDKEIYAVADTSKSYYEAYIEDACGDTGFYCDIYDFDGNLQQKNKGVYFSDSMQIGYRDFYGNDGKSLGSFITPKYAMGYHDNNNYLVTRDGEETLVGWFTTEGVTDNIVVISLDENNMSGRYFVDLDSFQAIKACPWVRVYPMSMGRALVYDGNKYGFIDENLELVIPCKYDISYARRFDCGVIPVSEGDGYFFINTEGEVVSQAYDNIIDYQGYSGLSFNIPGIFMLKNYSESTYRIIDATGHILAEFESSCDPTIEGNYAIDSSGNRHMFNLDIE